MAPCGDWVINVGITGGGIQRLKAKVEKNVNFLGTEGMRRVIRERGDAAIQAFKNNIESFSPGGVPDLKEKTKKQKQREVGFVYPILKRTGAMMQSMYTYVRKAGVVGWVVEVRFRGTENKVKAIAHITGGGTVPVRDFMKLPRGFSASVFAAIRAGLKRR